jgi:uncharacterized protein (TIGR03435 family)
MIRVAWGTVLAMSVCWGSAHGQAVDTQPAFEVASVKPAGPQVPGVDIRMRGGPGTGDPGRISYPRVFLMQLLTMAYGVPSDRISGPEWLLTEQYSVTAKIPPDTSKDRFNLMLRNLLVERFHLVLHHATKDFPAYELVVAEGGPKMKPAAPGEDAASVPPPSVGPAKDSEKDRNGFPVLRPGTGSVSAFAGGMVRSTNRLTMAQFAGRLGVMVNESNGAGPMDAVPRVVDQTGLTGKFEFTLEFAGSVPMPASVAALVAAARRDQPPAEASGSGDAGGGGPTLFTALEKQLGLRLVKGKKVSLDVLVIDHVDKVPTGD